MTEFKLPELCENIEQGDLVRLMISPGSDVKEGQPVMELETDKAVIEVPSSVSGKVNEIRVKEAARDQLPHFEFDGSVELRYNEMAYRPQREPGEQPWTGYHFERENRHV